MTGTTGTKAETAMLSRRLALTALGAAALPGRAARAQGAYPARPIRLVIPFAAGGPTDIVARLVADRMAARLGQPVVVDARPGAGGAIAAEAVARAAPDGHTLLIGTATTHAVNPALQEGRLPFHPIRDFAPIAQIARVPIVLVTHPDLPARDLPAFIGLLRARPGQMNYGSSGTGSMGHLAAVLLMQQLGTQATHIPYRGSAPMVADLLAGRVEFATDALASVVPFVQDSRIRAIAIATPDRAAALPSVPTFAEAGLPGFEAYTWNVVFAPAGTPASIIQLLNTTLNAVVAEADVAQRLSEMGQPAVTGTTPQGTADFVQAELAKWAPVVRASGATPS
jgi:tripartite-type tricarboxylate transporter receptor subunit TctC